MGRTLGNLSKNRKDKTAKMIVLSGNLHNSFNEAEEKNSRKK